MGTKTRGLHQGGAAGAAQASTGKYTQALPILATPKKTAYGDRDGGSDYSKGSKGHHYDKYRSKNYDHFLHKLSNAVEDRHARRMHNGKGGQHASEDSHDEGRPAPQRWVSASSARPRSDAPRSIQGGCDAAALHHAL